MREIEYKLEAVYEFGQGTVVLTVVIKSPGLLHYS